jgi:hypothetical protein
MTALRWIGIVALCLLSLVAHGAILFAAVTYGQMIVTVVRFKMGW